MAGKAPNKGKAEDLDAILASINKDFGAGTIMQLGDSPMERPETFSSGAIALDEALGIGGLPYGRVMEFYGPESSGKTSLALHAAGNVQRQGRKVAMIDAEHALDPAWAETLGVDADALVLSQPSSGEQALQVADRLIGSGQFGLIIIDSVAALVPEAELKGEIGDTHVALVARMMSQGLRMITGPASDTGTAVIFINQLREKVGVFFGSSETQPGGKALKFYSSIRLDVRRIQTLKDGQAPIGSRVRVKVVKNKLAAPFGQAEFDFIFGVGVSLTAQLIDLGVERGLVKKAGAHYSYQGKPIGQGKEAAKEYMADHPDTAAELEEAIRTTQAPPPAPKGGGRGRDTGIGMEGKDPWDDGSESAPESDT